jgi:hypothetical protein
VWKDFFVAGLSLFCLCFVVCFCFCMVFWVVSECGFNALFMLFEVVFNVAKRDVYPILLLRWGWEKKISKEEGTHRL